MKKIDMVKINDMYDKYKKYLPVLIMTVVVLAFVILTFFALYPFKSDALKADGEQRVEELNINFNSKILKELETKQKPSEITGIGGRDPFAKF
jgi:hypothetical protein